jgi:hypothetical protein
MSCWVVPSLAADVWQIPLEQLLRRMTEGEIPIKLEEGFTFVDMAPNGPKLQRPHTPSAERPAMCTAADDRDEANEPVADDTPQSVPATRPEDNAKEIAEEIEDENGPPDITGSKDLGDWRTARRKTGRTRIPPRRQQPIA